MKIRCLEFLFKKKIFDFEGRVSEFNLEKNINFLQKRKIKTLEVPKCGEINLENVKIIFNLKFITDKIFWGSRKNVSNANYFCGRVTLEDNFTTHWPIR